jgi:anti-sigma regulatory factor (Ser/Thr protein kinase)
VTQTSRREPTTCVLWSWTTDTPGAAAQARATLRCALDQLGYPEYLIEDSVLAVGELVANAVEHGVGPFELRLRRKGHSLLCEVEDHDPRLPGVPARYPAPAREPDLDDLGALCAGLTERGRGLLIVQELTQGRWGFRRTSRTAKAAWMALPDSVPVVRQPGAPD